MKTTLFIISVCTILLSKAQSTSTWVDIKSSTKYEKDNSIDAFLETSDGTVYSFMSKKDKDVINIHDASMNISSSYDLPQKLNGGVSGNGSYLYEGAFLLDGKLHILKSIHNEDKTTQTVSYFTFDNGSFGPSNDVLDRVDETENRVFKSDFVVSASPGGEMLVIFSNNIYKKEKEKNSFDVTLFDSKMQKLSARNFKKFFKDGEMIRNNFKLLDNGDLLVSYTLKVSGEHKNYVMLLKKDATDPIHILIDYKSKRITEFDLFMVNDEKAMVTGMFYEGQEKIPGGFFTMYVNTKDGSIYDASSSILKGDLKEEADVKGFGGKSQTFRYVPVQTVKHDDKTISVVFEQFLYMVTQNSKGSSFSWDINYYIVIARVDIETGKIKNSTIIPKKQSSEVGAFNSVICTQKNNKLYIIFNDHGDNKEGMTWDQMELAKIGNPGSKHPVSKVIVEVDAAGKAKREILYSEEDERTSIVISDSFVRKNGDLMLFYKLSQSAALLQDWSKNFHLWNVSIK